MTELPPATEPSQPAPEAWSQTQYYEGIPGTNMMLGYGTEHPVSGKVYDHGVTRIRTDSDYVPKQITTPSIEVAHQFAQPVEAATSEPQVSMTRRPEEMRTLRKQVAQDMGEAVVSSQVTPPQEKPVITERDEAKMNKARTEADAKYSRVLELGGTPEEAEAAANRIWKRYGIS